MLYKSTVGGGSEVVAFVWLWQGSVSIELEEAWYRRSAFLAGWRSSTDESQVNCLSGPTMVSVGGEAQFSRLVCSRRGKLEFQQGQVAMEVSEHES